jgi:hypothetical protein
MALPLIAVTTLVRDQIDYEFISRLEGGRHTTAYVPAASTSNSGVTVATGFDLGQRNERDLRVLGLSESLISKLTPYLGKKKDEAARYLQQHPLTLTAGEAEQIDIAYKAAFVRQLRTRYIGSPHNQRRADFFSLPAEAQTVIASVSFQYGNLATRTPMFWRAASSQNWAEAVRILNNFGDLFSTRRRKEAELLATILP